MSKIDMDLVFIPILLPVRLRWFPYIGKEGRGRSVSLRGPSGRMKRGAGRLYRGHKFLHQMLGLPRMRFFRCMGSAPDRIQGRR